MTRLATRLLKLEAATPPREPQPETAPFDLDALLVKLKQHQAETAEIQSDPDAMRRYRYWQAEVERDEQPGNASGLATGKVDTASRIAALALPLSRYHLRAAELELLHAAGYDTSELQEQYDKAAYYAWRHHDLPADAQAIVDQITEEETI